MLPSLRRVHIKKKKKKKKKIMNQPQHCQPVNKHKFPRYLDYFEDSENLNNKTLLTLAIIPSSNTPELHNNKISKRLKTAAATELPPYYKFPLLTSLTT
jgi:hypothetical protein